MNIMSSENLKIAATLFSLTASLILAWRVKNILTALALVADMHEYSINELSKPSGNIVIPTRSNNHVKKAKGTMLLVIGFFLYGLAAVLNFLALTIAK